ncbi:MAG: DUF4394 domain-containing protein [Panacagrimonas sp.]
MKLRKSLVAGIALCVSGLTTPAVAVDRPALIGPGLKLCAPVLQRGIALTADQRLVCFSVALPQLAVEIGALTGFIGTDTALIGIDYRVQDGKLYGVGNTGGVYTVDVQSAALTLVSVLTVAPVGTSFGVDFNPAADRLRIVSNTGQNLRHQLGGATIADAVLNNGAAVPVTTTGIVGAAYTNNDLSPRTATTLFDISATTDQVLVQSPANSGILAPTGTLTTTTEAAVGFDIRSMVNAAGDTVSNQGFATFTDASGVAKLYTVDVLSGVAGLIGGFSPRNRNVIDISFPAGE